MSSWYWLACAGIKSSKTESIGEKLEVEDILTIDSVISLMWKKYCQCFMLAEYHCFHLATCSIVSFFKTSILSKGLQVVVKLQIVFHLCHEMAHSWRLTSGCGGFWYLVCVLSGQCECGRAKPLKMVLIAQGNTKLSHWTALSWVTVQILYTLFCVNEDALFIFLTTATRRYWSLLMVPAQAREMGSSMELSKPSEAALLSSLTAQGKEWQRSVLELVLAQGTLDAQSQEPQRLSKAEAWLWPSVTQKLQKRQAVSGRV